MIATGHTQEARWTQLSQQALQLEHDGETAEALPLAQEMARVAQATWGAKDSRTGLSLDLLGKVETELGRFGDAQTNLQQALAIDTNSLGPTNIQTASAMVDLGKLYGTIGQWGAAGQLLHNALPVYLQTYGNADVRVADVVFYASEVLLAERQYQQAMNGYTMAATVYQRAKGDSNIGVALCLNRLGSIAEDGLRHDVAESLDKRALEIAEKALGPNSMTLTDYLEGLARVYKNEQKFADAEPLYQRSLKILQAGLKPNDPDLRDLEADLAALYYVWGKPSLAMPYFQAYLGNLMDEFRANAATMSERDRLIYLAQQFNAFPLFFSFVLKFHDQKPELAGQMYDALLEQKGMIAESAASMRAAVLASGDPQAGSMLDKLANEKAQLAALVESMGSDQATHAQQVAQLQQESNALEQALLKRSAAMSQQKTLNAATWHDVQKALKPGEAAVEVTRFPFHTGFANTPQQIYVALVVTPESKEPEFVLLGDAKDLEAAPMAAYRADVGLSRGLSAVEEPPAAGEANGAPNTNAAYRAFWKPLEPALRGAKRVYFASAGVLNTIPIGLMADSDGRLVMEKVQLRVVNSTRDLLRTARIAQAREAVLVGNPQFDLTAAQQRSARAELTRGIAESSARPAAALGQAPGADQTKMASRGGDLRGGDLAPLPGTQVEIDAVGKLLKSSGWKPTEYTGNLALKDAVTRSRGPRVMHIATHGFFLSDSELQASASAQGQTANLNEDPMLRAGLFFAGADRVRAGAAPEADVDDGVLTAFEASQLNLEGTELVVLSACETGLGKELNTDGVFGLRRGLQEAGADAVLMSMWSVPDQETQELMALFYQKWLGGLEKPEALRQAQLSEREIVRKRYGRDLPYYWGAFVLVGR